jgi:S-DNA-T family DNA segregation ATPase FtsK/SpoIIIE
MLSLPTLAWRDPRLQQVLALVIALLGVLLLVSVLGFARTRLTDGLGSFARYVFGMVGAALFAIALIIGGAWALRALVTETFAIAWRRIIGGEVCFFAMLALIHAPMNNGRALAESGGGGGIVGWAISEALTNAIGFALTVVVLFLIAVLGAVWAFELDLTQIRTWSASFFALFPNQTEPESATEPKAARPKTPRPKPAPTAKEKPAKAAAPISKIRETEKSAKRVRRDNRLPTLDLFRNQSKFDIDRALLRERARIIEDTLDSFGIPIKVLDDQTQSGPTVTLFALEPGFVERRMPDGATKRVKVKVSRIAALANDLALALSASPIRIEAPVPGKPYVGLEVPNETSSMVALRGVLDSDAYRRYHKPLKIALGQDVAGVPIFADLAAMPHVLIAGATGSGKSVCINAVIASLLCNNTPDDLRLLMIDPKMVELVQYNGIPHLLHPVVTDLDKASGALHWAMREMDKRYQLFKEKGVRNLEGYNKQVTGDEEKLPYVIVVIDELADLMMTAPEDIEKTICRLAQMARATGIHLVLATQRPSVDVVTGLIKANFPARIAFAVTSQTDSRVILDTSGAEKLLGRGDMLYMAPDSPKLLRLQGCYVSDDELKNLVRHWRDIAIEDQLNTTPIELPTPETTAASKEKSDELLDEAIKLAQQFDRASTSFLQRRMGIGYNRAARLIDLMEARGIIGPAKDGGLAREVLLKGEATPEELAEE